MNKVMINNKICDNSPACGGIEVCPTGAFRWDESARKIEFDESKCVGCGACVKACPVFAIKLARSASEAKKIQDDIDADPRAEADLFVDRYGGDIVDTQLTPSGDAVTAVAAAKGIAVLEVWDEASAHCLVTSIPMSEIFAGREIKHIKTQADDGIKKELGLSEVPALVFFKDGMQIGKVEGYFENNDAERGLLGKKIAEILG